MERNDSGPVYELDDGLLRFTVNSMVSPGENTNTPGSIVVFTTIGTIVVPDDTTTLNV